MVMDMMDVAPTSESDAITFYPEPSKFGQVTATVPITWTLSEKALEYVATHRNSNPHLLIVVASAHTREHTHYDYSKADKANNEQELDYTEYTKLVEELTLIYPDYSVTSIHVVRLLNRAGELATPKEHISFHRAGDNIIFGKIIQIQGEDSASEINGWRKNPKSLQLVHDHDDETVSISYTRGYTSILDGGYGSSTKRFSVPSEMFARERPAWQKRLVKEFFRGHENDECHFRKRLWFGAVPLTIVVQIYGLFVRLGALLFGVAFAKRHTFSKQLFALNPYDYANSLGYSWWYRKKDGTKRSLARWIFSIPTLLVVAVSFVVSLLPGVAVNMFVMGRSIDHVIENIISVTLFSWMLIAMVGAAWFVLWIVFTKKGHRFFGNYIAKPIGRVVSVLAPKRDAAATTGNVMDVDDELEQLIRAQAAYDKLTPSKIENSTFKLKFDNLKMRVCRPFQRPADFY